MNKIQIAKFKSTNQISRQGGILAAVTTHKSSQTAAGQNSKDKTKLFENIRECPQCRMKSLYGMRGSVTSICANCGFKDPCCGD